MLTQKDVDLLMQEIQSAGEATLYYVAHMIEPREGILDEHIYKSNSKFKVIKITVNDIINAYFAYLDYYNNPTNYHTETEICYYDHLYEHTNFYVVPNDNNSFDLPFNSRLPSIIYGYRREILDTVHHTIKEISDPTPVKANYTNTIEYADYTAGEINEAFEAGLLDWKYMKLDNLAESDGIEYNYVMTDWYILSVTNFPRTELPLINTKQQCAYFLNKDAALNYIEQLEA